MEGVCWNSTMYCLLQMRHNFCTELCTDGVDHHEFPRLRSIAKKKKRKQRYLQSPFCISAITQTQIVVVCVICLFSIEM